MIFKEEAPWFTIAHRCVYEPMRKEVIGYKLDAVRPPQLLRRRPEVTRSTDAIAPAAASLVAPVVRRLSRADRSAMLRFLAHGRVAAGRSDLHRR